MKIAIYTLGCKANQYETQAMEAELVRRGHHLVDFDGPADAYIVNTCAVTAASGHKSRQAIRRCKKHNPAALVAVCGCYAQIEPEEVAALTVDLVSGPDRRMAFLDDLEALAAARQELPLMRVENIMASRTFEQLPAGGLSGRTRAMLKVEDGCANFCAYCVIPYARGPVRSLPLEAAVEETRRLAREGYREIVLTGIEISSWGRDLPGRPELTALIEAVCGAAEGMRVRLGSLEPRTVTEDFCRRCAPLDNLCPHFHLSMQSGCDATLARMNRRYTTARYLESVDLLRRFFPDPAVTTDLIVGFPGETEEEFSATLDFVRQCAFAEMHVFPYSIRPGTPAAEMEQVPGPVKEERAGRAGALAARLHREYLDRCAGRVFDVLYEQGGDGLCRGHAPNYMAVAVRGEAAALHNRVLPTRITGVEDGLLLGELAER